MTSRFECLLDGVSLAQVDGQIYITDIVELPPEVRWQTARPARGSGMLVTDCHRRALQVKILFVIRHRQPEARALAMEQVRKWCRGRRLQISGRPGRWLSVRCTSLPQISSALRWTDTLETVFTAWDVPFWQDVRFSKASLADGDTEDLLFVPGCADYAPVSVALKNTSATVCSAATVTCGDTLIALSGLQLAGGETLLLLYDDEDRLSIAIENTSGNRRSAMACRSATSSDDLLLPCGKRSLIKVEMAQSFTADFSVRGRWL